MNNYNKTDNEIIERLKRWSEYTNGRAIFSDHTFDEFLKPYFDEIHIVGQRIDTPLLQPVFPSLDEKREIVIVHAPSNQLFKGTKFINQAVENLKTKGLKFKYIQIENKAHHEAI